MYISVVIPCYNSGQYLDDALKSVIASHNINANDYEIIVVDDGSTDKQTLDMISEIDIYNCTVVHQENKGPGGARNTGVRLAKGKYVLFLDSDNKIRSNFMATAMRILNKTDADIVYGKPAFFGTTTKPRFETGEFAIESMLVTNHIDVCSMIRKSTFEAIGGFDEDRKLIAFEDWEMWIRAGAAGCKFHFVNEVMFDYRITNNSLLDEKNNTNNYEAVVAILYQKYGKLILDTYRKIGIGYSVYRRDEKRPFRTFFKNCYYNYFYRFVNIHTLYKRH